jgi:hypothetical protein
LGWAVQKAEGGDTKAVSFDDYKPGNCVYSMCHSFPFPEMAVSCAQRILIDLRRKYLIDLRRKYNVSSS